MVRNDDTNGGQSREGRRALSPEHSAKMTEGRANRLAVEPYLRALRAKREQVPSKGGRPIDPEVLRRRIKDAEDKVASGAVPATTEVQLRQQIKDDRGRLAKLTEPAEDPEKYVDKFIERARVWGDAKGIDWDTWLAFGVPVDVLERAGITKKG